MDIDSIRAFFMWCTILNVAMLLFSWLICLCAGDWVYGIHSKLFSISRETFNVAVYSFMGLYKIVIMAFNFIPFIALSIVG
ncbi:MAG: DUF6868 family protein [Planctomycetota bacterium]